MTARRSLSLALLADLDYARSAAPRPTTAMRALPERAVQFGTGAFLRGFVDSFLDDANRRGRFLGRVVAIGSTGSGRDRAFGDQDGLYTLVVAGLQDGRLVNERRIIGAVSRAVSATAEWDAVLALARDPNVQVIFSNTTEAGLALDARDADAPADGAPHSFPAKLTRFLHARSRALAHDPRGAMVVLPCELVEDNGTLLESLVREQAVRWSLGDEFAAWLATSVRFCNTLVDRIVPGTPDAPERQLMADVHGYDDALLTVAEPYALFVIEGDEALAHRLGFVDPEGRIRVVPDVRPYRERKVRLLNGTHTAMAALGVLGGIPTVHDAMCVPALAALLRTLVLHDLAPMLDVPDAAPFAETVLQRFANPQVRHRLTDIATQGTLKWRVRLLPMLQRHASVTPDVLPARLVISLAAQLYLSHPLERARRAAAGVAPFADALGDVVHAHWLRHAGPDSMLPFVAEVLADRTIWGDDLPAIPGLAATLAETLNHLHADGVQALLTPATVST